MCEKSRAAAQKEGVHSPQQEFVHKAHFSAGSWSHVSVHFFVSDVFLVYFHFFMIFILVSSGHVIKLFIVLYHAMKHGHLSWMLCVSGLWCNYFLA